MGDKRLEGMAERNVGFVKKHSRLIIIVLIILLGVALIAMGSGGSGNTVTGEYDSTEEKLTELCSRVRGVGECRVMVTYKESQSRFGSSQSVGVVESVAVVCKGADKSEVRAELTSMLCALFGIRSSRIHISKMK